MILPASAYTEKSATYVNTEGRVQMTTRAGFAPGDAKEDWAILRALSDVLGHKLPFDSLAQLRAKLYEAHPHFARLDTIEPANPGDIAALAKKGGRLGKSAFASPVQRLLFDQPNRTGLRRHGRMFEPRAQRLRASRRMMQGQGQETDSIHV